MDNKNDEKVSQYKLIKFFVKLFTNTNCSDLSSSPISSRKNKNSHSSPSSSSTFSSTSQLWYTSNLNDNHEQQQILTPDDENSTPQELNRNGIIINDVTCFLLNLADEIIISICHYLSINDILHFKMTSKTIMNICNDISIWKGRFVHVNTQPSSMSFISIKPKRPTPRLCPSSVQYGKYMYVYGGDNGYKDQFLSLIGDVKNDLWRYDLETRTWEEIVYSGMKPKLTEHSSVLYNGAIIMFGGSTGCSPQYSSIVYQYDIQFNSITVMETKGNVPSPRSAHSSIIYKDSMYVFGGWDGCKSNNKIYKLDLITKSWSLVVVSGDIPHQRRAHCSLLYKDSLYLFGGFDTDKPPSYFNILYKFDLINETWEELKCNGDIPSGRSRASMIEYKGKFYLYGGWDRNNYFQEIHEYDVEYNHWRKMSDSNISQLESIGLGQNCSVIFKDSLVTFGGYSPLKKTSTNEMFCLRLE